MKAIILAGGFARRLWPLTKNTPKSLLPVGGKPIIEYILERLSGTERLDKIYLSVNQKFEPHFRDWLSNFSFVKDIELVAEKSMREEEKLGAIGALGLIIKEMQIEDDLLVVAGDNLFDFDINNFVSSHNGLPMVALYDMFDKEKVKGKYGVVLLDKENMIREFHEKPEDPVSSLISTGCYFFPKKSVEMINNYLSEGQNADAPGFFVSWLSRRMMVQGFVFDSSSKWFDIGSIESYETANRVFGKCD